MKKIIKIIMVILMLMGIGFSIFNFLSVEIKAGGGGIPIKGAWVYSAGQYRCMGDGTDCTIGMFEPKE